MEISKGEKKISEYLLDTEYCDHKHSAIVELAEKLTQGHRSPKVISVALFYWVRDNIKYQFGSWSKPASVVLEEGTGMCTNKALLLVALLRACGVPAGFGIMKVKGKEYFGPVGPEFLTSNVGDQSVHVYAYVYLDDKWFKLDPTVDKQISLHTSYFNHTTRLEEWDGSKDGMHHINPKHIIEDVGPLVSIDYKLKKKPRNAKGVFLKIANFYLEFLRKNRRRVNGSKHIERLFIDWLKKEHWFYYSVYIVYIRIKLWKKVQKNFLKARSS